MKKKISKVLIITGILLVLSAILLCIYNFHESERALQQVIFSIMADNMEIFKQYQDNPAFRKWLADMVFNMTYNPDGTPYTPPKK